MNRPPIRPRLAAAAALLLAACGGGGIVALLSYVAPIGGNWVDPAGNISIVPNGDTSVLLFDSKFNIDVNLQLQNAAKLGSCVDSGLSPTSVAVDGRDFTLLQGTPPAACAHGTFQENDTLAIDGGPLLRNSLNISPPLFPGIWVDSANEAHRIKFGDGGNGTFVGCEFVGATRTGTASAITAISSDPATGAPATLVFTLTPLAGGPAVSYGDGVFQGISTVKFGTRLTLERRRDDTTTCP